MADNQRPPIDQESLLWRIHDKVDTIRANCGACHERLKTHDRELAEHELLLRGNPGDEQHGLDVRVDRLEVFQRRLVAYVTTASAAIGSVITAVIGPALKGLVGLFR